MRIADAVDVPVIAKSPIKFSGIYAIVNDVTKMAYIGSSVRVDTRYSTHKHYLNGKHKDGLRHKNRHLQADWDIYGEEMFSFVLLEECSRDELIDAEQRWMEYFGIDYLYNIFDAVRTTTPQEVRDSISRSRKHMTFLAEHRENLSKSHKGVAWSEERRAAHKPGVQDKSLNMEKATEIRRLSGEGLTYKELAARFNVDATSIYAVLNNKYYTDDDYAVALADKKAKIAENEMLVATEIRRLKAAGVSYKELAVQFDMGQATIYNIVANKAYIDDAYTPVIKKMRKTPENIKFEIARRIHAGERAKDLSKEFDVSYESALGYAKNKKYKGEMTDAHNRS